MDISPQMLSFANVVEQGNISAGVRAMGRIPSAASKQIGSLENQVHYRLLNKTRTGVVQTQEGQEFCQKRNAMAKKCKKAEAPVLNMDGPV